ncbi:MAG: hypothetical protein ACREP1_14535, partial [Rhodanobacteraceae bacterium]
LSLTSVSQARKERGGGAGGASVRSTIWKNMAAYSQGAAGGCQICRRGGQIKSIFATVGRMSDFFSDFRPAATA